MARQAEQINITALARMMHATTPNARKKLNEIGLKPSIEIPMPSGRTYVVYEKTTAMKALEKFQKAKEKAAQEAAKKAEKEQALKAAQEAKEVKGAVKEAPNETVEAASELDTVKAELQEMKTLMSQILDNLTKPSGATH